LLEIKFKAFQDYFLNSKLFNAFNAKLEKAPNEIQDFQGPVQTPYYKQIIPEQIYNMPLVVNRAAHLWNKKFTPW